MAFEFEIDRVFDEDGDEVFVDGQKKSAMTANHIGYQEVTKVIDEQNAIIREGIDAWVGVRYGLDFEKDDLAMVVDVLRAGKAVELAEWNKEWYENPEYRKDYLKISGRTERDMRAVMNFIGEVRRASVTFNQIAEYLDDCMVFGGDLLFRMFHNHFLTVDYCKAGDLDILQDAFYQYDKLYTRFNSAEIYMTLYNELDDPIHMTKEDVINVMAKQFDSSLKTFLVKPGVFSAGGQNRLSTYDKMASDIARTLVSEESYHNRKEKLTDLLSRVETLVADDKTLAYYDAIIEYLKMLIELFDDAIMIANDYQTISNEAPWQLMHYPPSAQKVMNKLGYSAQDPQRYGTSYEELFNEMSKSLVSLAGVIVSNADQYL